MKPTAAYFAIGNELLSGKILDRNGQFLAKELNAIGLALVRTVHLPDEIAGIVSHLRESKETILITSGGLGPTPDDRTCLALSKWLGKGMTTDEQAREKITRELTKKGLDPKPALKQSKYPCGFKAFDNKYGLAPILFRSWSGRYLACLPGVPSEFSGNLQDVILPKLKEKLRLDPIYHVNLSFMELRESEAAADLKNLSLPAGIDLAYLPHAYGLTLRLSGRDKPALKKQASLIQGRFKNQLISTHGKQIHEVMHDLLKRKKWRLGVAESCTGGKLAAKMTALAGASAYFDSGVISYSNDAKMKWLDVDKSALIEAGAVSKAVALAMCKALVKKRHVDAAVSITGIAGPGGGRKDKPLGTVWIGIFFNRKYSAKIFYFSGSRTQIQDRAVAAALYLLWKELKLNR